MVSPSSPSLVFKHPILWAKHFEHIRALEPATGSICAKQCNETVSERTHPHAWAWWFNLIGDYTSYMYIIYNYI